MKRPRFRLLIITGASNALGADSCSQEIEEYEKYSDGFASVWTKDGWLDLRAAPFTISGTNPATLAFHKSIMLASTHLR